MNDIKESISVQQVHGNADKYIITNRAVEEVNGDKLIEIYKSIEQGLKRVREDLVALPEEIKKRTDYSPHN
jgi:hypothetical protein